MFEKKEIRVFLNGQAKESYLKLKKRTDKESLSLLHSIQRIINILKENPQFGDPIEKKKIPKNYTREKIKNLYRCKLSNYWILLYTIEGNKIEILIFILNIMDHKKYNKLLRYKNK